MEYEAGNVVACFYDKLEKLAKGSINTTSGDFDVSLRDLDKELEAG